MCCPGPGPWIRVSQKKKKECLRDKIITVGFEKLFLDWVCQVLVEMHKKYTRFYRFLLISPSQLKVLNCEAFG